jgi:hypothetical protein
VKTFTGTAADGTVYTLTITDDESYVLTVGDKTSSGAAEKTPEGYYTLTPSNSDTAFTVTTSGNGITAMSGEITFDDGTKKAAPAVLTPPPPPAGGNQKTIIINGYPGLMEAGDVHFTLITPVGNDPSNYEIIAGAWSPDNGVSVSNNIATIQLKNVDESNWTTGANWTGSGTFDVWITPKGTQIGAKWYKSSGVSITEATTTIEASSFSFSHQQETE